MLLHAYTMYKINSTFIMIHIMVNYMYACLLETTSTHDQALGLSSLCYYNSEVHLYYAPGLLTTQVLKPAHQSLHQLNEQDTECIVCVVHMYMYTINFKEGLTTKDVTYKVEGLEILKENSGTSWDSIPVPPAFQAIALIMELLEPHGSGAEDKLYVIITSGHTHSLFLVFCLLLHNDC